MTESHPVYGIAKDIVAQVPTICILIWITRNWDGEYALLVAMLIGIASKNALDAATS